MARGESSTARNARRDAELEELTEQIRAGVEQVSSSEQWKRFLDFAASFHTYSARNQILMFMQKPNLTQVAGYNHWKKLGRQVRKGEKGLRILAPVTASMPYDRDGNPIDKADLDSYSKSDVRWKRRMVGVKPTSVFDVSQTDGDPLPEPPGGQLLEGAAPEGMWDSLVEIAEERGFRVEKRDLRAEGNKAEGFTSFSDKLIVVRDGTDDAEAVATLTHEVGHMLMHDPGTETDVQAYLLHRGQAEVEAESFTYIVAAKHGLDTSGYSFDYINGWAGGDPDKVLASADRVTKTAKTVLERTLNDAGRDEEVRQQSVRAAEVRAEATRSRETVTQMTMSRVPPAAAVSVPPAPVASPAEVRMRERATAVLSSPADSEYPTRLYGALEEQRAAAARLTAQLQEVGDHDRSAMMRSYQQILDRAAGDETVPPAPAWRSTQAGLRAAFDADRGQQIEGSQQARLVRAAATETALGMLREDSTPENMAAMRDRYTRTVDQWRLQSQVAHVQGEAPVHDRGRVMREVVEGAMSDAELDAQRRELAIAAMTAMSTGDRARAAEATIRDWEMSGTPAPDVMMTRSLDRHTADGDAPGVVVPTRSRTADGPSLG